MAGEDRTELKSRIGGFRPIYRHMFMGRLGSITFFRVWLIAIPTALLALFVNCSGRGGPNIEFSHGGTGTDGFQYYSYGTCGNGQVGISSTISTSRDLQSAYLLRQNCQNLAKPQSIALSQVKFAMNDNSVLTFNGQIFDRQTGFSGQKVTIEFCRSTGVSPEVQASVWSVQGTTTSLFGSLSLGDGTGSGTLTVDNPSSGAPLDYVTSSGQGSQFNLSLSTVSSGSLTYTLSGGVQQSIPSVSCVTQSVPTNPILFKSRSATYATTNNSATIDTPAGMQAGDVMIAQVWGYFNSTCPDTVLAPAGWVQIRTDSATNYGCLEQFLFYKIVTGSEPANYTFSLQTPPTYVNTFGAAIVAYSGIKASAPIDAHACSYGTTFTATSPSINLGSANEMLLFTITQSWSHGFLPTTPAYLTQRIGDTDNSAYFNYIYDGTILTSGPTAVIQESIASGNGWFACQIGLAPGP